MAHADHHFDVDRVNAEERLHLGERGAPLFGIAAVLGAVGLVAAIVLAFFYGDHFRRFYFAYLIAYAFFLSIGIGAIAFVLLQHIARAGWSVSVRRVAETLAAGVPVLAVMSLPLIVSVMQNDGGLYRWAQPAHAEQSHPKPDVPATGSDEHSTHANTAVEPYDRPETAESHKRAVGPNGVLAIDDFVAGKRAWLNGPFWVLRILGYLIILSGIALWYRNTSIAQDGTGDVRKTHKMQDRAGPLILISGLTITFLAFDLLMSLDPTWYSTIFGVYYLAGSLIAAFACIILICKALQAGGWLRHSISTEHYHDLGKFLFGFVFFWGYIAYSQYMLLWYANVPETTSWLARRGATTVEADQNPFTLMAIVLLVGHLLIPFAGLLSRHVKRNRFGLAFWAAWMLVLHYLDLHWLIMPEYSAAVEHLHDVKLNLGLMELATFVGVGGVFAATFIKLAGAHALRPARDPRLHESLAFHNI